MGKCLEGTLGQQAAVLNVQTNEGSVATQLVET